MAKALCDTFSFPHDVTSEELSRLVASRKEELMAFARRGVHEARTEYLKLLAHEHRWRSREGVVDVIREPAEENPSLSDFAPVTLDERHVPRETFAPLRRHSYYLAQHANDAIRYPLSQTLFRNRHEVYTHGVSFMGAMWRLDILRTPQLHVDPATGRKKVHALIINEMYEPRWGSYFCTDCSMNRRTYQWQQDLTEHPVTVFIRPAGVDAIRYCGEWSFERLTDVSHNDPFTYVEGQRGRMAVFRVSLASYDARWGPSITPSA